MTRFSYKALDSSGNVVEGMLDVASQATLFANLRDNGLSPLRVRETEMTRGLSRRRGLRRRDVDQLIEQLGSLLAAGLPMASALDGLAQNAASPAVRELAHGLVTSVRGGESLSKALETHAALVPRSYLSVVRAGEMAGSLDEALQRLTRMGRERAELISRLRGALTYPAAMVVVMCASLAVLLTVVVPRFTGVFDDLGASLPLPTRLVVGLSDFLASWWILLVPLGVIAIASVRVWRRTPSGREAIDAFVLRLPFAGQLALRVAIARHSSTLAVLLHTGVPLVDALVACRDAAGNSLVIKRMAEVEREIIGGASFADSLRRQRMFPALLASIVATGESTGALAQMLRSAADHYEREIDASLRVLTTLLEPAITVAMGLVVGFVVLAMLLPVFELGQVIG